MKVMQIVLLKRNMLLKFIGSRYRERLHKNMLEQPKNRPEKRLLLTNIFAANAIFLPSLIAINLDILKLLYE